MPDLPFDPNLLNLLNLPNDFPDLPFDSVFVDASTYFVRIMTDADGFSIIYEFWFKDWRSDFFWRNYTHILTMIGRWRVLYLIDR